jgi:dihydrofolate reductase
MEAIYATDINHGLSKNGIIPWKSKKDMSFFMNKTMHNVVIMGRKTYYSLPRPLKDRLNIVLTSNPEQIYDKNDKTIFTDDVNIFSVIQKKKDYTQMFPFLDSDYKIFIIGGKQIYEQYIHLCKTVWVTRIKKDYSCDLFFDYDFSRDFEETLYLSIKKIISVNKKYIIYTI